MTDLPLIAQPLFYALAIPAVLMVGITKAGVGGSNVLGVALMSMAVSVPQAAAILLPIICVADLFGLYVFWKQWDIRNLKIIIPGATAGVIVGALTFRYLDSSVIKLILGLIALWFATAQLLPFKRRGGTKPAVGGLVRGTFWSTICGYTSFVAHAGQVPLSVFLIPQRLDKTVYLGTIAIFYAYLNYFKLLPFWWLGQLNLTNVATSVVMMPLVPTLRIRRF